MNVTFALFPLMTIALSVLGGVALIIFLLVRPGGNSAPAARAIAMPPDVAANRADQFREKHDHYNEERSKILGMVDDGKISADEAHRLIESLGRETALIACPFCTEEIRVEAVKCKHCGAFLTSGETGPKTRMTKSNDKVLAGVCSGIAEHYDFDPALLRILLVLVALFSAILPVLIAYVITAIILPAPPAEAD
jgi:phage shock protein C